MEAFHRTSVHRHRNHERERDELKALATSFALERHAAELDILEEG